MSNSLHLQATPSAQKTAIFLVFSLGCMSLMVATGIGRFVFTPILPIMLAENTVEMSEVIWLSSANYIGYFIGAMSLFKNTRHILMLCAGLLAVTVSTFFSSLTDFYAIFFFRVLAGIGGAWALVSASAWAVPWLSQLKIKRVGFIYTGVGAGIALSGTVCSLLILQDWSATQLWYAVAFVSLILSILVSFALYYVLRRQNNGSVGQSMVMPDADDTAKDAKVSPNSAMPIEAVQATTKETTSEQSQQQSTATKPSPAVWRLAIAYGLFGFGYIIPATFLPKIAKDMLTGNTYLLIWPMFGVASVLAVSCIQFFSHIKDIKIWRTAQLILGLATLLPLFAHSAAVIMTATLLIGATFMLVIMSILKIASRIDKNYNLSALVTACFAFGQLAGPLPALIFQGANIWNYVLPLSAFSSLLGVLFIWRIKVD